MVLLGIDPGASGAVACFDGGQLVRVVDMPTVTDGKGKRRVDAAACGALVRDLGADAVELAVIERVGAMPGQGVSSMFAFGVAYGTMLGVLGGLQVPVELVTPVQWKREMHVGRDNARQRASQLLPAGAVWWPRVKDEGRAEASLIGLWAIMKRNGSVLW
jgi:crossover junction endodeoxyribonuclease RuvC